MLPRIVGVDFDNTIAAHDDVLHRLAVQHGLIGPHIGKCKKLIRDTIWRLPNGETTWQQLQARAYGIEIGAARLIDGVPAFFRTCRDQHTPVYIVSHKTEFAAIDDTRTNLRDAALRWMWQHGFFDPRGLGLSPRDVYFEATRSDKIARIRGLGCTHFIDDLVETFLERSFPTHVERILYAPNGTEAPPVGVRLAASWDDIGRHVFHVGY